MPRTQKLDALILTSLALVVLGSKLMLIDRYGSNVPYWDQWDAEAKHLYEPYLNGSLTWQDMFAAHNEHRIFVTRLYNLALLELNGLWFPKLQMVANAVLHVGIVIVLVRMLSKGLSTSQKVVLGAVAALALSLPFGWENTLAGFQSQFYFVFGFSLLAIMLMVPERAFSGRWIVGFLAALAACFSVSSGVLVYLAIATISALQIVINVRERKASEYLAIPVLLVSFVLIFRTVPTIEAHNALKASSATQFIMAMFQVASWPTPFSLVGAALQNLPILVLLFLMLKRREKLDASSWLMIGVMAWVGLQWISFAYGRAGAATAPRYTDTLMVGVLINIAAALHLTTRLRKKETLSAVLVTYFAVALVLFGIPTFGDADSRKQAYDEQTASMREYFVTEDPEILRQKPFFQIPYPVADTLAQIASSPQIKSILHTEVTGIPNPGHLHLPSPLNWAFRAAQLLLMKTGFIWLLAGIFGFLTLAVKSRVLRIPRPPRQNARSG